MVWRAAWNGVPGTVRLPVLEALRDVVRLLSAAWRRPRRATSVPAPIPAACASRRAGAWRTRYSTHLSRRALYAGGLVGQICRFGQKHDAGEDRRRTAKDLATKQNIISFSFCMKHTGILTRLMRRALSWSMGRRSAGAGTSRSRRVFFCLPARGDDEPCRSYPRRGLHAFLPVTRDKRSQFEGRFKSELSDWKWVEHAKRSQFNGTGRQGRGKECAKRSQSGERDRLRIGFVFSGRVSTPTTHNPIQDKDLRHIQPA